MSQDQAKLMSQDPAKQKIIFAAIIILILFSAGFFVFQQNITKKQAPPLSPAVPTQLPSPTPIPLTPQNIDQNLDQTSTDIQESLDQVDADLKAIDQIDVSDEDISGI